MKKILSKFALPLIVCAFALVSCQSKQQLDLETATVDMKVEGMVCAMGCAKYIEDQVAELDGVLKSEVIFEDGIAKFEFNKNVISSEELEEFIDEIHDGQYDAEILANDPKQEESTPENKTTEENDNEEVVAVSEKFQISFPQLLSYFLKSLR